MILHKEFVPTGQTVNSRFYCDILRWLRENVWRRHPELWWEQTWRFTMKTPHLTLPSSPSSFWQNTKWLSSPTHHTPLVWHPVSSSYFQIRNWNWKDAGLKPLRRSRPNPTEWLALDRKGLASSVPKMEEMVGLVSICGRYLFQGWWQSTGLMVSFMIFLQCQSGIFWILPCALSNLTCDFNGFLCSLVWWNMAVVLSVFTTRFFYINPWLQLPHNLLNFIFGLFWGRGIINMFVSSADKLPSYFEKLMEEQ
jgi:hypothetical protein